MHVAGGDPATRPSFGALTAPSRQEGAPLRVLSGRLKAVLVATFAAAILIGSVAPTATLASDPPGLARFMYALGKVESGGDYYARNASSGAYGKYQIMPASWRAWAGRYLDDPSARTTPANQDAVAAGKLRSLHASLGTWRRTAYWWLTGSSRTSGWSSSATRYVDRLMAIYRSTTTADIPFRTTSVTAWNVVLFSEKNARITYTGTWKSASDVRYRGDTAAYSREAGATATLRFSGRKVIWMGPVGPTRGRAKITIDGTYVKTIDLVASRFSAHHALFSKSWAGAGPHTLRITVVGTPGRPSVGIDGFSVTL